MIKIVGICMSANVDMTCQLICCIFMYVIIYNVVE